MTKGKGDQIKLPVMAILAAAFIVPWGNKIRFGQALAITFTILVVLDYFTAIYAEELGFGSMLLLAINLFVYVSFAVVCHRLVLLGNTSIPKFGIIGWSGREFRFFIWGVKVGMAFLVALVLTGMIVGSIAPSDISFFTPILILLSIPFAYLVSRISPLFPATATGKIYDLKWAFTLTEGNGLRMMVIVILIPIIMIGVNYIIEVLFGGNYTVEFITIALGYVVTVFEIAAVSLSYDFLSKRVTERARMD